VFITNHHGTAYLILPAREEKECPEVIDDGDTIRVSLKPILIKCESIIRVAIYKAESIVNWRAMAVDHGGGGDLLEHSPICSMAAILSQAVSSSGCALAIALNVS